MTQPCIFSPTSSLLKTPPPALCHTILRPPHSTFTMATSDNNNPTTHLDQLFTQKRTLRPKLRNSLKSMDSSLRSQEDDAIQNHVLGAHWFKSSQRLCAYISCSALREVDTSKLLSHFLHNDAKDGGVRIEKKLYVPRVEDKNCHMRMFHISSMDDLIANSMNILEPAPMDINGNEREDGYVKQENWLRTHWFSHLTGMECREDLYSHVQFLKLIALWRDI